jgi:hypothetical protein
MEEKSTQELAEPAVPVTEIVEDEALVPTADDNHQSTLARFETDPEAEAKGVWFKDHATGVRLLVAHGENENYTDYFQQLIRPYISLINSNSKEGYQFLRKCEAKAKARFVLLGWEGLTDEDGTAIPYSPEMALKLLTDRKYRKVKRLVDVFSADDSAFGPDRALLGEDF